MSSSEHNLKLEATLGYYSMSTRIWAFQLLRTVTGCSWKRTPRVLLPSGSTISIFRAGSTCGFGTQTAQCVAKLILKGKGSISTAALWSALPGSISQDSCSTVEWQLPSAATWWTACVRKRETSSLICIMAYTWLKLSAYHRLLGVYVTDLRRRSWQSSCRRLILSGPICQVPPSPWHTRRFTATRKAFIWRRKDSSLIQN